MRTRWFSTSWRQNKVRLQGLRKVLYWARKVLRILTTFLHSMPWTHPPTTCWKDTLPNDISLAIWTKSLYRNKTLPSRAKPQALPAKGSVTFTSISSSTITDNVINEIKETFPIFPYESLHLSETFRNMEGYTAIDEVPHESWATMHHCSEYGMLRAKPPVAR